MHCPYNVLQLMMAVVLAHNGLADPLPRTDWVISFSLGVGAQLLRLTPFKVICASCLWPARSVEQCLTHLCLHWLPVLLCCSWPSQVEPALDFLA